MAISLEEVEIGIPPGANAIVGQSHFIKTVEDVYEAVAESGVAIKFGVAFCEASGPRLVRSDGNDAELVALAEAAALKAACGHSFFVFLREGFPVSVLNRIKGVSEVCSVFAATANPLTLIVAETKGGRGIMGVVDGMVPLGIETPADKASRVEFLKKTGYKR